MTMQLELMTIGEFFYGFLFVAFEFKMDYFFNMVRKANIHKQGTSHRKPSNYPSLMTLVLPRRWWAF